jgi:broad specificity phosphatase PhoE
MRRSLSGAPSTLGSVPADRIHLVRHGEVDNPERILYGTLDGYGLTSRGLEMARAAADYLGAFSVSRIVSSPLQRTKETAGPLVEMTGLPLDIDERVIEGDNAFQGTKVSAKRLLSNPRLWPLLRNPLRPSWGEPYKHIVARMMEAIDDARGSVDSGDVVVFTHQLPIWMVHSHVAGKALPHLPSRRRCTLGSVTSLVREEGKWREVDYQEPAKHLLVGAIDLGAV